MHEYAVCSERSVKKALRQQKKHCGKMFLVRKLFIYDITILRIDIQRLTYFNILKCSEI